MFFHIAIKEKYDIYDRLQKEALDVGQENASRRRQLDAHAAEQRKLFEGINFSLKIHYFFFGYFN